MTSYRWLPLYLPGRTWIRPMCGSMCYLGIIRQQFLPGVQEMLRHSVANQAVASTGASARGCIDQMLDLAVETSEIAQLKEPTFM
jgi:hypothetical protein